VRLQQIIENTALLGGDDSSALMDDFEQKYEDSRPEPWVVYCKHKESCNILAKRLRAKGAQVGIYHGDTDPDERTEMEDQFQAGELDVVVGTIDAMKEGITMTRSHLMYFMSRSFVPDVNEQCEAREDRLGQQKQVVVYIPQATDTVATSRVHPINRLKEKIVRTVLPKDEIKEAYE
jgi:SNF2 family DNA or RNA helicase